MSEHDSTADVLFHAAMCLGVGRKSSVRAAIANAVEYLYWTDDVKVWRPYHETFKFYCVFNGHDGEPWPRRGSYGGHGGSWLAPEHKAEQITSVLLAYEYLVQELGAKRSPVDPDYS